MESQNNLNDLVASRDYAPRYTQNYGTRSWIWTPLLVLPLIVFGILGFNSLQEGVRVQESRQAAENNSNGIQVGVGGGAGSLVSPIPSSGLELGVGGSGEDANEVPESVPNTGWGK